jgi:hypothetical protein
LDDLLPIISQAAIGPIRVGQTFSETLRILGNPDYLDFRYDDMFDGTLSYGPAEIFVRINGDNVSSYLIQLRLFKRTTGRHLRLNKDVSIKRPKRSELSYDRVRDTMIDSGISFKTNSLENVERGMHQFLQFNDKVRFYFLRLGRKASLQLNYIELCDFHGDL